MPANTMGLTVHLTHSEEGAQWHVVVVHSHCSEGDGDVWGYSPEDVDVIAALVQARDALDDVLVESVPFDLVDNDEWIEGSDITKHVAALGSFVWADGTGRRILDDEVHPDMAER